MQVASVVSGIFFKAKITECVKRVGSNTFCNSAEEVAKATPCVILLDLEHPDAHRVLQQHRNKVIAFGPHVRHDLLAIGREFGAQVYPRSVFFNQLEHLLDHRT